MEGSHSCRGFYSGEPQRQVEILCSPVEFLAEIVDVHVLSIASWCLGLSHRKILRVVFVPDDLLSIVWRLLE